MPAIFRLIQEYGKVEEREMFSTFNMGIGMVLIVSEEDVDLTMKILEQEKVNAWVIGTIQKGEDGVVLK